MPERRQWDLARRSLAGRWGNSAAALWPAPTAAISLSLLTDAVPKPA